MNNYRLQIKTHRWQNSQGGQRQAEDAPWFSCNTEWFDKCDYELIWYYIKQ